MIVVFMRNTRIHDFHAVYFLPPKRVLTVFTTFIFLANDFFLELAFFIQLLLQKIPLRISASPCRASYFAVTPMYSMSHISEDHYVMHFFIGDDIRNSFVLD